MLKMSGVFGLLLALSAPFLQAQSGQVPKQAIDITAAEIKEVQKTEPPKTDQQLKIADMGKYNLGVGVIHRGPTKDNEPLTGFSHDQTGETYIILSGSGTLVTGGTMVDPKPIAKDSEAYQVLNGPTEAGGVRGGYRRKVGPGDVIIIPQGVFHGWAEIKDHIDYLSVRPDPDKILPAGYVNPTIRK
jgi:mannose-6-phosphate isomerase-like protein (cupin superfamily)